jgi:hypothetical protein
LINPHVSTFRCACFSIPCCLGDHSLYASPSTHQALL